MNDLKPHKHGQEGTHGACKEMCDKYGDKVGCCECNGHECKSSDTETDFAINPDVTKVEEMDWEKWFDEVYYDTDSKTRVSGFWDEHNKQCKDFIRQAISTAVKEEKERTKQVVRQAQIAMEYIEDDEQADWCLARFDAMLDEDLKSHQPK